MKQIYTFFAIMAMSVSAAAQSEALTIVSVYPSEGEEIAQLKSLKLHTSDDSSVGYVYYKIMDLDANNSDDACIMAGEMKKQEDGSFAANGLKYIELLCYEGHEYENQFFCYTAESDRYTEIEEGGNVIAVLLSHFKGATSEYQYSPVSYLCSSPNEFSIFEDSENGLIQLQFSDAVETINAFINGGVFGSDVQLEPVATEDKSLWEICIPSSTLEATSGSIVINIEAFDLDGLRVKGNVGEGDESVIELQYSCYLGSPSFDVNPNDGIVGSLTSITAIYEGGINPSGIMASMTISRDGVSLFEFYADDAVYNETNTEAVFTLPAPIIEAGDYVIQFPTMFFSLGEEFNGCMNHAQSILVTVDPNVAAINTLGSEETPRQYYNLMGQRLSTPFGIVIKK